MSDYIPPRAWTWPPPFRVAEIRAHEIVVGPAARVEQSNYGVIGGLLSGVFRFEGDNPYIVHPQAPLRRPPLDHPRSSINSDTEAPPISSASLDLEPQEISLDDSMELSMSMSSGDFEVHSPDLFAGDQSNEATVGDNSDVAQDPVFPRSLPGQVSMTNLHIPASGRGQGRIEKGDLKLPDYMVYKVNPNGCFTEGGGRDIPSLLVEVKPGDDLPDPIMRLSSSDLIRLIGYFRRMRNIGAVGAGVLLIVKGDAYFWHYEELPRNILETRLQLQGRYSRRIDSWEFMEFLWRWKEGGVGVRFDA